MPRGREPGEYMLWRTHFVAGAGAGLGYGIITGDSEPGALAIAGTIGGISALLADIDSRHSKLGRAVLPVSFVLNATVGHRGYFHSLVGMALCTAVVAFIALFWLPSDWVFGALAPVMALGYSSHLILDALTKEGGVPLLWPYSRNFALPLMATGGLFERLVFMPALTAAILIILWGRSPWNS